MVKLFEVNLVFVNFLSSVDIIGGNLGLLVMNGKGELVGFNFDLIYELIIKDWYFNVKIICVIYVDIWYMFWLMEEVDNVGYLLDEMILVK